MQHRMNSERDAQPNKEVDPEYVVPAAVSGSAAHLPGKAGEHWPDSHCPGYVQGSKYKVDSYGLAVAAEGQRVIERGKEEKNFTYHATGARQLKPAMYQ
jgi:hypothetical protein